MERLAGDKHSSLLQKFVTYGRKKFYNIGPRCVMALAVVILILDVLTVVAAPVRDCKTSSTTKGRKKFEANEKKGFSRIRIQFAKGYRAVWRNWGRLSSKNLFCRLCLFVLAETTIRSNKIWMDGYACQDHRNSWDEKENVDREIEIQKERKTERERERERERQKDREADS
jgi:hypothetical protein